MIDDEDFPIGLESNFPTTNLSHLASNLPKTSGVYLFKNTRQKVLYVGKAKNLRARVSSYFSQLEGTALNSKTKILVNKVVSFEVIMTANETEALLLENSLIKKLSPPYNINLKDGKSYPLIRLTNEVYPRIFRTRHIVLDGSEYYGPFPKVGQIDFYLQLIDKLFPLRKRGEVFKIRKNPCLNYQINRCSAPCTGLINESKYQQRVEEIRDLLKGKTVDLVKKFSFLMNQAAISQQYEKAAQYRDKISLINELNSTKQDVVKLSDEANDYIGVHNENGSVTIILLQVRGGSLIGKERFNLFEQGTLEEILPSFLIQFYSGIQMHPATLYLNLEDSINQTVQKTFNSALMKILGKKIKVYIPKRGRHLRFVQMAENNARVDAVTSRKQNFSVKQNRDALKELKSILGMTSIPYHIETFDVSHLGGRDPVASMVVFIAGQPQKESYRTFKLRSLAGKPDDYKSISEVVARRYSHVLNEDSKLPDLVLIDGGRGQVNSASKVMKAFGINNIFIVGLAKKNEELYLPNQNKPIVLPLDNKALQILQAARDEAHRVANNFNRRLGSKQIRLAIIESVRGIGPVSSFKLLATYGSAENIISDSPELIASKIGIKLQIAEALHSHLLRQYGKLTAVTTAPDILD